MVTWACQQGSDACARGLLECKQLAWKPDGGVKRASAQDSDACARGLLKCKKLVWKPGGGVKGLQLYLEAKVLAQQTPHDAVMYVDSFVHHLHAQHPRRPVSRALILTLKAALVTSWAFVCIPDKLTSLFHSQSSVEPSTSDSNMV